MRIAVGRGPSTPPRISFFARSRAAWEASEVMRKALAGERAAETFRAGRRIYRSRVAFALRTGRALDREARRPNELALSVCVRGVTNLGTL